MAGAGEPPHEKGGAATPEQGGSAPAPPGPASSLAPPGPAPALAPPGPAPSGLAPTLDDTDRGPVNPAARADASPVEGRRLGPYRLVKELGHGGMGAVFLAVRADDQYHTQVAIKFLHRGFETAAAVARFRDERQILANLDHPCIVRLLDGGSTEDRSPYLVMEYVEGTPITRYADERGLSVRERVELFRHVCAAVAYAHQKLVVHRDIKPSNILVTSDGTPKLLDFGIAKLPDVGGGAQREARTGTGMRLLTPEYASPEQAQGLRVSTATDIYSLGAVLYELLCGRKAHIFEEKADPMAVIREVDPPRPSTVAPPDRRRALAGDLDNIVLKALHKQPIDRYSSVEQLSQDMGRHLAGLPIEARTATWTYRAGKFVRRHYRLVSAMLLVVLALSAATVISLEQARRADRQARRADEQAVRADEQARRAERRFADVRKLANSLLLEVDEKIRDLEGSTAARELIVRRALEYLDGLAAEAGNDAALSRELAVAYMKVGDVLGNTKVANLGRHKDALDSYRKAKQILDRLAAAGPEDQPTRWLRAGLLYREGSVLRLEGEPELARERVLEALSLVQSMPRTADFDYETVVLGHLLLFELGYQAGDIGRTVEYAVGVLNLAQDWARATNDPDARYWVGVGYEMSAAAHIMSAYPENALHDARQAARIFEELAAEHAENQAYRREQWYVGLLIASFLAAHGDAAMWRPSLGDYTAAEEELRRSLPIITRLAERDPDNARAQVELAANLDALAVVAGRRNTAAALEWFQKARATYEAMPESARRERYATGVEWFHHCAMAPALARKGRRAEALAEIEAGLAMMRQRSEDAEATLEDRVSVLSCDYLAADTHGALGDLAASAELVERVAAELEKLIAENPTAIAPYVGLVQTLELTARFDARTRCDLAERVATRWRAWPGASTAFTRARIAEIDAVLDTCGR